jgi:ketosteroid isomerase-like protein
MTTAAQVGQDNVALIKRGYEAFGAGDMATLSGLYHPDAVFSSWPHGAAEGNYRGRDAIFAFFAELFTESKGTFKVVPMTIAAADDRVFVLQDVAGERNGYALRDNSVMVFTLADGLVTEMREFYVPGTGAEAFWSA